MVTVAQTETMIDDIDPKLFLESFINEHTCERCDQSDFVVGPLTVRYCCLEIPRKGYTLKHQKKWRACARCLAGPGIFGFEKWITPVISSLVKNGGQGLADTLRDILTVQPMAMPAMDMFYMDYVEPAPGPSRDMIDAVAINAIGMPRAPKICLEQVPPKIVMLKNRRS